MHPTTIHDIAFVIMKNHLDEKINIAYLLTPITFGGAERVNLNFLKNVNKDKFTIEPILFLRPWESECYFESEIKRLGFKYVEIPVAKSIKPDIFRVLRCFYLLINLINGKSYDLIHTHGYLADILGVLVSRICRVPIISTCHGFINDGKKLSLYNYLDCFALRFFNKIISVSDPLKCDLINKRISEDKITVIENTPDLSHCLDDYSIKRDQIRNEINVSLNEILIGYIGRLSPEKGVRFLLESFKFLVDSSQIFKLVIIGDGHEIIELKEIVKSNNLSSKVIFTGFQKNISEWLAVIDIFVLPSLTEGTPMILLEAMGHGVPCIASAVGGIPNIIESGVDGIMIPPGKPEEISNAVRCLISDTAKKGIISNNAKEKILKKYNINNWTRKIENEYLNIFNPLGTRSL